MNKSTTNAGLPARENWSTKIGVILAVAGSAVGLGNFLRFPGVVAQNGGGAFMIPYFLSFLLLGIPVCWAEWIMGRRAGRLSGLSSSPGLFGILTHGSPFRYMGALGLFVPVVIYMYYVYVESWCLAYAWYSITGALNLQDTHLDNPYQIFFSEFTGQEIRPDGPHFFPSILSTYIFFLITFITNFYFIYRGLSKGIEFFCRWAMPMLVLMAFIVVIRVITLGTPNPALPEQNVINGLGYMWNPDWEKLWNAEVWVNACGQIFFSLSVGFGIIITYASYLKKDDDVVLSGLTASSANEFCEVCLGGLMVIPAAFVFLGMTQMESVANAGTFSLGFVVMPHIFDLMPGGMFFSACFYFLLFLAGITSSLSMLQPAIAFFEEGFGMNRKASVTILSLITFFGANAIIHSEGLTAMDTVDNYASNLGIPLLALFEVCVFVFILKPAVGMQEAMIGSDMKIPKIFGFVITYITPIFLLAILGGWVKDQIVYYFFSPDWEPMNPIQSRAILLMVMFLILLAILQTLAWPRMRRYAKEYQKTLHPDDLI
ncbi:MAG TPA: sodium-dependent transporter [bacterium]|nr:sodium-dependent transporter [bacterium]HOL96107.1 sodium-dependent transporter [bacterium]HPP02635.1 sodium-dependent transporter [bacterium]HXK92907.1 sodium-dependent transporter [bacterium]